MTRKKFIMFGAHPDDADILFGGTAIKLLKAGHKVIFIATCDGSAGHHQLNREAIAKRRKEEVSKVARHFGLDYEVLPFTDGQLEATLANRQYFIRLIRRLAPDVIITHRINDYHSDHRVTSQLIQDAAFMLGVPLECPDTPVPENIPVILLSWDKFEKPYRHAPSIAVAVDDVLEEKLIMLGFHESQFFEWLPYVMRKMDQVPSDKAGRRKWLIDGWMIRNKIQAERYRPLLTARYGGQAPSIQYAETFEVSEYGRLPEKGELETLFPL